MITVLLPFYNLGLGGVQTKIIDLANTLVKSDNTQVIVYLEKKERFDRIKELDPRVKVIFCPQILPDFIKRRYYYLMIFIIYFYRPFSVFISLEKSTLFLLKAKSILPFFPSKVVVNVDTYMKKEQIYASELVSKTYQTADAILAPSKAAEADFVKRLKIPEPPVTYLPNWIEVKEKTLQPTVKTREFLYAGRFEPQKDPLLYIKFMRLIKSHQISGKMVLFGQGSLMSDMQRAIKKYHLEKMIKIYPPSHQISLELKKTKYLVLLSKYEGMPLIGLEAMKYGTVILGKDVAGIQDLIQNGVTGVCEKNVTAIINSYLKIKDDSKKYKQMQVAAFDYLRANFDQSRRNEVIELLTQTAA